MPPFEAFVLQSPESGVNWNTQQLSLYSPGQRGVVIVKSNTPVVYPVNDSEKDLEDDYLLHVLEDSTRSDTQSMMFLTETLIHHDACAVSLLNKNFKAQYATRSYKNIINLT